MPTTDSRSQTESAPDGAARPGSGADYPGRSIELVPMAPGLWMVIAGCGLMVLGPLFGFLIGSMSSLDWKMSGTSPIYVFLFIGFLVAGAGLGIALLGGRRLLRHYRGRDQDQQD